MASSVSSERVFSSAGITVSKRRNRLKGDIVEALQALKCMIHKDLLFREEPSASAELDELDSDSEDADGKPPDEADDEVGWDDCVLDLDPDSDTDL